MTLWVKTSLGVRWGPRCILQALPRITFFWWGCIQPWEQAVPKTWVPTRTVSSSACYLFPWDDLLGSFSIRAGHRGGAASTTLLHPCGTSAGELPPLPCDELNRSQVLASCVASAHAHSCNTPLARRHRRGVPCVNMTINLLLLANPLSSSGWTTLWTLLGDVNPWFCLPSRNRIGSLCLNLFAVVTFMLRCLAPPSLSSGVLVTPSSLPLFAVSWTTSVLASEDGIEISYSVSGSCFFWLRGIWLRTAHHKRLPSFSSGRGHMREKQKPSC